jgi:hypothetical protein
VSERKEGMGVGTGGYMGGWLDLLQVEAEGMPEIGRKRKVIDKLGVEGNEKVKLKSGVEELVLPILASHQYVKDRNLLLSITFTTVYEYLWLLKGVSEQMATLGKMGMWYLAAAVSDFWVEGGSLVSAKDRRLS